MKIFSTVIFASLTLFIMSVSNSFGRVITSCGGSEGYSYFFKNSLDKGGWAKDRISKGQIIFTIENEKAEIIYKDILNTRSASEDGSSVIMTPSINGHTLVIVLNKTFVENYHFHLDANGKGEVAWGSHKFATLIPKSSLMVAKCEK
ncbi:hypothetical protein UZ36_05130 [Candidatus Nitromaritima sp. SCGC AAA799-C22]|nr:hypothetical protein UZ36_05130 [Candidatus Nitromaritima sp. SCGC AAA799-C22]